MPEAFKGSRAGGVQGFKCLRRSRVQVPAAFKGSRAFGVQGFKCLRRSNAFGVQMPSAFKSSNAFGVQGFKGILVVLSVLSASVVKRVWGIGFRG